MTKTCCLFVTALAILAALATPATVRAQPVCPPGYAWAWGTCRPAAPPPGYGPYAPPPPRRSQQDQAMTQAYCNQQQVNCANQCNAYTHGPERNVCYDECNAHYVNCTAWNTVR